MTVFYSPNMAKSLTIVSKRPTCLAVLDHDIPETSVINEPMLYGADISFAKSVGGKITKQFLKLLDYNHAIPTVGNSIFDSKVVQLMPGMYPAIPGWHCDEIKRTEGKVDCDEFHSDVNKKKVHYIAIVDFSRSYTQFVDATLVLPHTENLWKEVHSVAEKIPPRHVSEILSRGIYRMDYQCVHTAVAAKSHGWRWFGRLTVNTERTIVNQIRKQCNVYCNVSEAGW